MPGIAEVRQPGADGPRRPANLGGQGGRGTVVPPPALPEEAVLVLGPDPGHLSVRGGREGAAGWSLLSHSHSLSERAGGREVDRPGGAGQLLRNPSPPLPGDRRPTSPPPRRRHQAGNKP